MLSPKNIGKAATPARVGLQAQASLPGQQAASANRLDGLPDVAANNIASQLERDDLDRWRQSSVVGANSVAHMDRVFTALKVQLLTAPDPKPASRALAAMLFHGPPMGEERWPNLDAALGCDGDDLWGSLVAESKKTENPGQTEAALIVLGEIEARLGPFCRGGVFSRGLLEVLRHIAQNDPPARANAAILALHRICEAQKQPLNFNAEIDPTAAEVGVAMEAQMDLLARRDAVQLRDLSLLLRVASEDEASSERNTARANLSKVFARIPQGQLSLLARVAFDSLMGGRNTPLTSTQWIELLLAAIPHLNPLPSAEVAQFFSHPAVLSTVGAEPESRPSRTFIAELGGALAEAHVAWAVQATLAVFADELQRINPPDILDHMRRVGAGMALQEWAFAAGRSEAISRVFADFYEANPDTGLVPGLLLAPALKGPVAVKLWDAVCTLLPIFPEARQHRALALALFELAAEHNGEAGVHLAPAQRYPLELQADEVLHEVIRLSAEGSPRIYRQRLALLEQFAGAGSAAAAIYADADQQLRDDSDDGLLVGSPLLRWIAAQRAVIDDPILDDLMRSELEVARDHVDWADGDAVDGDEFHDAPFADLRLLIEAVAAHHPALLHEAWSVAVLFADRAMHPNYAGPFLLDAFESLKAIVPQLDASAQAKLFDESNDMVKLCFVSARHSLSVERLEDAVTRALPLLGHPYDSVRALAMNALVRVARTLPPGQLVEVVRASTSALSGC